MQGQTRLWSHLSLDLLALKADGILLLVDTVDGSQSLPSFRQQAWGLLVQSN